MAKSVHLCAALRNGGLKDILSRHLRGNFDWQEIFVLVHPMQELVQGKYLAVKIYGPGKLWIKNIRVLPLNKEKAEELTKKKP